MQKDLCTYLGTFWTLEKPAQDAYARDPFVSTYFNSLLTFPFSRIGIKGNCFQPKTFGTLLSPAEVYGVLSGTMPGNRSWTFLGKRISPKCLATLLGIRPQRFQRCASGRLDQRYRCFGSDTWVNLNYLLLPPGYCEIQHVLFNQNEMVSVS